MCAASDLTHLATSQPSVLRLQKSLPEPGAHQFTKLANQGVPEILLSLPPRSGIELRSSGVCSKHSTQSILAAFSFHWPSPSHMTAQQQLGKFITINGGLGQ